jgi:hypothetical protein
MVTDHDDVGAGFQQTFYQLQIETGEILTFVETVEKSAPPRAS